MENRIVSYRLYNKKQHISSFKTNKFEVAFKKAI